MQDWDAINVLRDELSGVQRGMSSMQQTLEACMEMQIELQRCIKQEVSAALNRSPTMRTDEEERTTLEEDGSQWKLARKGTCCICCDNQIDSLLYRSVYLSAVKCSTTCFHSITKCNAMFQMWAYVHLLKVRRRVAPRGRQMPAVPSAYS